MAKIDLMGMSREELCAFAAGLGEKPFRGKQLFRWIYGHRALDFEAMTNLAAGLRQRLRAAAVVSELEVEQRQVSAHGEAEKFLFRLPDGLKLESVLMREGERLTLCISSQVGCPIGCKFCATGRMGLLRNLTAGEIINQVLSVQRRTPERITNAVVMGMGEPLNNYDNVIKACGLISDQEGPNIAHRRIVISTSGLIPQIRRFTAENHRFRLAISLNATTEAVRTHLMPLNRKYPIAALMAAAREYTSKLKRRITFEYVLLAGVNDSEQDASRLKQLLHGIPCKLNLIPYNAVEGEFRRSSDEQINSFYQCLKDLPAPVTIRWSKGDDIDAACGQLWTRVEESPAAVPA